MIFKFNLKSQNDTITGSQILTNTVFERDSLIVVLNFLTLILLFRDFFPCVFYYYFSYIDCPLNNKKKVCRIKQGQSEDQTTYVA